MNQRRLTISVVGAGTADEALQETARAVGVEIARLGGVVVCGGLGGVMEAACRGAAEAGGSSVAILPGPDASVPIATLRWSSPRGWAMRETCWWSRPAAP